MSTNDVLSKLKAEIKSRMGDCDANSKNPNQLLWAELAALLPFLDTLKQEQPSEDLEAEMGKYFDGWHDDPEYGQAVLPHTYECVGVSDCKDISRHFYELGKQSKEPVNEDLDADITAYLNTHYSDRFKDSKIVDFTTTEAFELARHFYELGKQSREPVNEDLEAEITDWEGKYRLDLRDIVRATAYHFYSLGKQAKKEE